MRKGLVFLARLALAIVAVVLWRGASDGAAGGVRPLIEAPGSTLHPMRRRTGRHSMTPALPPEQALLLPLSPTELSTEPDLRVWVQVVGAEDDTPIAGAAVSVEEDEWLAPAVSALGVPRDPVLTDEDGLAELGACSWESTYGEVLAEGRAPLLFVFQEGHERRTDALVLRVPAASRLRGTVLGVGGEPLVGLEVSLTAELDDLRRGASTSWRWWDEGEVYGERGWSTLTASDGSFALDGLPSAPLSVEFRRAGRLVRAEPEPLRLQPGETREVVWRLGAGCTLRGGVVAERGAPVPGVTVWLLSGAVKGYYFVDGVDVHAKAVTDGEGRFVFTTVVPGTWSIGPEAPDLSDPDPSPSAFAPLAVVFEIAPGATEHEVTLEVFRGLCVSGRVLDPDGRPLEGSYDDGGVLGASSRRGWLIASAETGAFTLGPFAPGSVRLIASGFEGFAPSEPIEVRAGDREIELRLGRGARLVGRVIDAATGRPTEAQVELYSRNEQLESYWLLSVATVGDEFVFEGLGPGTYDLGGATADGQIGTLNGLVVDADLGDVVVPVSPGATLCVHTEDPDLSVFVVAQDGFTVAWHAVQETGVETCVTVPPGTLVVRAYVGPNMQLVDPVESIVTLAPGERRELVLAR